MYASQSNWISNDELGASTLHASSLDNTTITLNNEVKVSEGNENFAIFYVYRIIITIVMIRNIPHTQT